MFSLVNRNKIARHDFVVIDSQFPQKEPLGFRNTEINEYFKKINNFVSYSMFPMKPGGEAWFRHGYGCSFEKFQENKKGYVSIYKKNFNEILYLEDDKKYRIKLAYTFFLAETYVLLPFLNKNKIPFVFVLYPGGAFGINNKSSDEMLRKIFSSKYFRNVIVTQDITWHYLIDNNLCQKSKISYIYGGFVQFKKGELIQKKYYLKDKKTFDVCFVAAKYSKNGVDKGYDLFIKVVHRLSRSADNIVFHVIGGFDENDIDISRIKKRIKFYGYRTPDFLVDFYSKMDIFFSFNKPSVIYDGSFDGFPLGIDAAFCGVGLFVGDEKKMNREYIDGEDIVIVEDDEKKIEEKILFYYNHPDELYKLSFKGSRKTQRLFDTNFQIDKRIEVFKKFVKLRLIENKG